MPNDIKPVSLADIQTAHDRLKGYAIPAPLLHLDAGPTDKDIHLKLENLQPIGSFKVRPIGNAVLSKPAETLNNGIYTSSSGNSALGVAWIARKLGIPATAVVPDNAPEAKLSRLRHLDTRIVTLTYDAWWQTIENAGYPAEQGLYVDAVRDPAALAGDGTIGLEIIEQWPDVEAVLVPFGGGGLACGIACAIKAINPKVQIIACELESAHPATSAFEAGHPVEVPHCSGFVSGVGYGFILPEMWSLIRTMIDGTITVSLDEVARAIRIMAAENKVIAEGAGAVSVAAALSGRYSYSRVVAVVSGGNLNPEMLIDIMHGRTPG